MYDIVSKVVLAVLVVILLGVATFSAAAYTKVQEDLAIARQHTDEALNKLEQTLRGQEVKEEADVLAPYACTLDAALAMKKADDEDPGQPGSSVMYSKVALAYFESGDCIWFPTGGYPIVYDEIIDRLKYPWRGNMVYLLRFHIWEDPQRKPFYLFNWEIPVRLVPMIPTSV